MKQMTESVIYLVFPMVLSQMMFITSIAFAYAKEARDAMMATHLSTCAFEV